MVLVRRRRQADAVLRQQLGQQGVQFAACEVQAVDAVRQAETVEDWDRVRHALAAVQHQASRPALAQQCEDALDGHVQRWHAEGLEHDLDHLLAVGLGVVGRLREEHGVPVGVHLQLVEEGVLPEQLHLLEVLDDAVLQRVEDGELVAHLVHLVPEVGVPVQRGPPDPPGLAEDLGKDRGGRLVDGEARLADARAVVNNYDHVLVHTIVLRDGLLLALGGAILHRRPPTCGKRGGLGGRRWRRRLCATEVT
mmetsp:Transcript_101943/g.318590  ORF Transcript_101943/g.318590 Transcript_101943/m.318590 type:complete len:251 (+) Transcript_101943:604-1356(+)